MMSEQISPWIVTLSALLTPTIAIVAVLIAYFQYGMARQKRRDDLFDRRYAFYQRLCRAWLSTGTGAKPEEYPDVELDDLIPLAIEASFLFGDDIEQHILSLKGKGHQGHPDFPNDDFVAPFEKYLRLEPASADTLTTHLLRLLGRLVGRSSR